MTDNLESLKSALKRGTKRSRLVLLTAVCDHQHKLAEVVRGDDGALMVIQYENGFVDGAWRPSTHSEPLQADGLNLRGWCRCGGEWSYAPDVLVAAAEAGKKRVVVRTGDGWESR